MKMDISKILPEGVSLKGYMDFLQQEVLRTESAIPDGNPGGAWGQSANWLSLSADQLYEKRMYVATLSERLTYPLLTSEMRAKVGILATKQQRIVADAVAYALSRPVSQPVVQISGVDPGLLRTELLAKDAEVMRGLEAAYLLKIRTTEAGLVLDTVQAVIAETAFAAYEAERLSYPEGSPLRAEIEADYAEAVKLRDDLAKQRMDQRSATVAQRAQELKDLQDADADLLMVDVIEKLSSDQAVDPAAEAVAAARFQAQETRNAAAADQAFQNEVDRGQAAPAASARRPPSSRRPGWRSSKR